MLLCVLQALSHSYTTINNFSIESIAFTFRSIIWFDLHCLYDTGQSIGILFAGIVGHI